MCVRVACAVYALNGNSTFYRKNFSLSRLAYRVESGKSNCFEPILSGRVTAVEADSKKESKEKHHHWLLNNLSNSRLSVYQLRILSSTPHFVVRSALQGVGVWSWLLGPKFVKFNWNNFSVSRVSQNKLTNITNHPFGINKLQLIPFDNWPVSRFAKTPCRVQNFYSKPPKEGNAFPYSQQSLANCNSSRESSFCPCLAFEWLLRRIKRRVGLLSVFPFKKRCCGCTLKRSLREMRGEGDE